MDINNRGKLLVSLQLSFLLHERQHSFRLCYPIVGSVPDFMLSTNDISKNSAQAIHLSKSFSDAWSLCGLLVVRLQTSIRTAFCQCNWHVFSQTGMFQLTIHTYCMCCATQTFLNVPESVATHFVSVCEYVCLCLRVSVSVSECLSLCLVNVSVCHTLGI